MSKTCVFIESRNAAVTVTAASAIITGQSVIADIRNRNWNHLCMGSTNTAAVAAVVIADQGVIAEIRNRNRNDLWLVLPKVQENQQFSLKRMEIGWAGPYQLISCHQA